MKVWWRAYKLAERMAVQADWKCTITGGCCKLEIADCRGQVQGIYIVYIYPWCTCSKMNLLSLRPHPQLPSNTSRAQVRTCSYTSSCNAHAIICNSSIRIRRSGEPHDALHPPSLPVDIFHNACSLFDSHSVDYHLINANITYKIYLWLTA